MLKIKNICVDFNSRRGNVRAVDGVSLTLERGEILGLVGESGAGKSTVGGAIMGLLDGGGRISRGSINFEGEELAGIDVDKMREFRGRRIGMIFQNPLTSLNPVRRIGDQLSETIMSTLGLDKQAARERAIDWMRRMQLPDPEVRFDHYPHEFSGGQRQRIVIALALCGEPDLVIADEPTTALDVSVQAEILGQLATLVKETNIGVILITHNMGVVAQLTQRVAIMRHGKLVETGETEKILTNPETDYARMLCGSVPPSTHRLKWMPTPDETGKLGKVEREDPKTHHESEPTILEVCDVNVVYSTGGGLLKRGTDIHALKDMNFTLKKGFSLGMVGESGSGKSTCARAVVGLAPLAKGSVIFEGTEISNMSERQRRPFRPSIQMIFQDPYSSVNSRLNIRDVIAEPLKFYGIATTKSEIDDRVAELLRSVHLSPDAMKRYPHQFSGGQRQRIAIARTIASKPHLIICDEPTSALDVSVQAQVLNLIKELQEQHKLTLLFISHDLPVVRQMCDDILVLKNGKTVEYAPAQQFFEEPQHAYSQHLLNLVPRMQGLAA